MSYSAVWFQDQLQGHQIPVPIALEVETLKTDEVLQLVAYLHSGTKPVDEPQITENETWNL